MSNDDRSALRDAIMAATEARGWTRNQLAEAAEINHTIVYRLFAGQGAALDALDRMCGALGITHHAKKRRARAAG